MNVTYSASADTPAADTRRSTPSSRRAAFAVAAIFILVGPAPGQLFDVHSVLLREWRMFSGAGVGLMKGHFTLHRADGAVVMSPLEVLGVRSYLDLPIDRRVYKPADLRAFASRICDDARETGRLSFEGSIGTFAGWRALTVRDVCSETSQTRYEDARP